MDDSEYYDSYCKSNSDERKRYESIQSIREYLEVMKGEPEGYIKLSEVYNAIKRMLPDE